MSQNIIRLPQLETPKKRDKNGGWLRIKKLDYFLLLINFFSIAIKFCLLVEDGLYSVIASFQKT